MTKKLYHIAEAILDSAIEEYRDINLADADVVQAYAEMGMGIVLTDRHAEEVKNTCVNWIEAVKSGDLHGTNDYYYHVIDILDREID